MNLSATLPKRILVLDGAMGTLIQSYKLHENDFRGEHFATHPLALKGCYDILNITNPHIIRQIHNDYLVAGADIISTNTFNAQSVSLSQYGLEKYAREINLEAAGIAKAAAGEYNKYDTAQYRYVAGIIGPAHRMISQPPEGKKQEFKRLTFSDLINTYAEQADALIDGGVDLLIVETIFDIINARAALSAIAGVFTKKGRSLPVIASLTLTEESGRLLSKLSPEDFLADVSPIPLLSIGFNCSPGVSVIKPHLERMATKALCYVHYYPAAGLPDRQGIYQETPASMAAAMETFMRQGLVNIVGGCCGTTPEYVTRLAKMAKNFQPRIPMPAQQTSR